jgi:hypothetical protein
LLEFEAVQLQDLALEHQTRVNALLQSETCRNSWRQTLFHQIHLVTAQVSVGRRVGFSERLRVF